ncbi:MAG: PAS domain S-box protein [Pseudomonadota bacterium]
MLFSDKLLKMMEQFMTVVSSETGFPVNIFDNRGYIIRSTDRSRIGNFHAGAKKIVRGSLDEYAVTEGEAARDPLIKEGYNCCIIVGGRKMGAFGITGPLAAVKPLSKIAARMINSWINELEYQEKLRQSEEKFRTIFTNLQDVYFETTLDGVIITSSPSGTFFSGYSLDELIGNRVDMLYNNPDDRQVLLNELRKKGRVRDLEMLFKRKDGSPYDVSINADMFLDDTGKPAGLRGTIRDMTDRKNAEQKLRKSEEKFRLIVENAPLGILHFDSIGVITACNDIFVSIIGSSKEKLIGLSMLRLPDKRIVHILEEALKGRTAVFEGDYSSVTADKVTPVRALFGPVFSREGVPEGGIGIIEDVTDRRRAEAELVKSERRFRELAELLPETIFEVDLKGRLTFVNQKAFDLFGYSHEEFSRGLNLAELISEPDREKAMINIQKILQGEAVGINEYAVQRKDGTLFPALVHSSPIYHKGCPVGFRGFLIDITEKKRTQELLIQSEKMLSIGGLAAGMAHEINNPLAGMIQNAQVLINRLSRDLPANLEAAQSSGTDMDTIKTYMEKRGILQQLGHINTAGQQAARIVQNMLSFARKTEPVKTLQDLPRLIDKTLELIKNDYDLKQNYDFKDIKITQSFDPDLPKVPCEETKIQ